MRFLSRIMGSVSRGSLARQERRSAGRRASRIELERLESRDLMSAIPGVSLTYGNLSIKAPNPSGNVAAVSIAHDNNLLVTLNGQSEEFSVTGIYNITYTGGSQGGDQFTNNTNLVSLEYGYGGNNTFTGGTNFNYVYFQGNNNTFSAQVGAISDVFEDYGTGDIINKNGATVQVYSF